MEEIDDVLKSCLIDRILYENTLKTIQRVDLEYRLVIIIFNPGLIIRLKVTAGSLCACSSITNTNIFTSELL